jgi:hypothetical protein
MYKVIYYAKYGLLRNYFLAEIQIQISGEDNIKKGLQEVGSGTWTGLIWLRRGSGGGLL